jgi:DNA polymerase I-like protein with 3'-5' exonuclease and polymerase domains/uracil-DNA glycosylase
MIKVPPSGPTTARIMIVGEAPGATEEKLLQPFIGQSGEELTRMLHEAGILRTECFLTNVCKVRPPGNDIDTFIWTKKKNIPQGFVQYLGKWMNPVVAEGIEEFKKEIETVKPTLIIALGNTAMWALTGLEGIMKWRGSILSYESVAHTCKVIPTIHPAMILRAWEWRAIAVRDLQRAKDESEFPEIRIPEYSFTLRPSYQAAQTRLNQLLVAASRGSVYLAVDIETRAGFISCIGIAWNKLEALCIPFLCLNSPEGYWSEIEEQHITATMQRLLTHPNIKVIGQNFAYDSQYFAHHWGYLPRLSDDTMVMQHCAFPGIRKSLDFIASMYCKYYRYWKDEGKNWNPKIHTEEQHWNYNCLDAVNTFECFEVLSGVHHSLKREEVYNFQMHELHTPVLKMGLRGCRIDRTARAKLSFELLESMAKLEQHFIDILGHPLNPRSNKQMKELFYDDFHQKEILNYKTGNATLNDEALQKLAAREPLLRPLVEAISDYRTLGVFQSTFVEMPLDADGRVRTSFNIAGPETFRFSSSENAFGRGGNLQNIPGADKEGGGFLPNIRKLFIPDQGYVLIDADLEKADAQVVAWEADDKVLMQMFREGADVHTENAKIIFPGRLIKKDSHEYAMGKRFIHGTNYLATARGLAAKCGITAHEAEKGQRIWFQAHPNIKDWQNKISVQLQTTRTISNVFGYKRFYFDRINDDVLKQAVAWLGQSTTACVINRGLVNIDRNLPAVQLLLQVHDSLVMQVPEAQLQTLLPKIHKNMLIPVPYPEPLTIQVGLKIGQKNWGELQTIKL